MTLAIHDDVLALTHPPIGTGDSASHKLADKSADDGAWAFEGFAFDPGRGELRKADGTPVPLRPKAEFLLRLFLEQPGRLLRREALIAAIWPHVVVTDDSLVQCVGELRAALDDRGQQLIRTVPRRGYRWEAEVRRVPARSASDAEATSDIEPPSDEAVRWLPSVGKSGIGRSWFLPGIAVACIVALLAMVAWRAHMAGAPIHIDQEIAAGATVAVMPFAVAAEDPVLRGIASEVADQITTQLSSRIGMRGIHGATTSAGTDKAPDLEQVAKALKATRIVTGRVGPVEDGRIHVDVRMVGMPSGEVLWVRRFERPANARADIQDDIGLHVVNAVRTQGPKIGDDHKKAMSEASRLAMSAWRRIDRSQRLEDVRLARAEFEEALRADPESIITLNGIAATYATEAGDPRARLTPTQEAERERIVDRTRRLAPEDPTALLLWGSLQDERGHPELALPAIDKAIRLVPSYANGYRLRALTLLLLGRSAEVEAAANRAIALGEGDPVRVSSAYSLSAEAAVMQGQPERAIDLARKSVAEMPSSFYGHAVLAAAAASAGHVDQARAAAAAVQRLWPEATVAGLQRMRVSVEPAFKAQRVSFDEGLRDAGLPLR